MRGGRGGGEAKTRRAVEDVDADETLADDAVTDWAVWQLVDPLLPTGGFAHSQGLEAAAHAGLVAGGDERATRRGEDVGWCVETFAIEACRNAASMSIPFVEAARYTFAPLAKKRATGTPGTGTDARSVSDADAISAAVAAWRSLDDRAGACLAGNRVASRASTATGAALLRAVTAAFGDAESGGPGPDGGGVSRVAAEALRGARAASRPSPTRRPGGHLATSFGAVAGSLGLSSRARGSSVCLSHPSRHAQRGDAAQSRGSSSRRGVTASVFWTRRGARGGGCAGRRARGWRRGGARRVRGDGGGEARRGRLAARGRRPGRTRRALLPTLLQLNRD